MYIDGKLVVDRWEKQSYTTQTVPIDFVKGKKYKIQIDFHEDRGEANIELIWNYGTHHYEKDMEEALQLAKEADYVLVTAGIHEGEFQDRSSLSLPGNQEEFIHKLSQLKKPAAVILVGGSAIKTTEWKDKV